MFKKILWTLIVIISAIIVFFVVWPIPFSQWSGLLLGAYPTGNEDKTLAEKLGYTRDDIIVIVHADDLAIHKDQSDGALDAMNKGIVKTGSVMVPLTLTTGDYTYWSSPETKTLADQLGIIFIGYKELQKLQARNWGLKTDSLNFKK